MTLETRNLFVLKKNHSVVPFDGNKIKSAIRKSAERINVTLTPQQEDFVVSYVENLCSPEEPVLVKTLHNYVECALDSVDSNVARSYREYRNYKTQFVKMLDQVYRKKLELSDKRDASNANADSDLITTQKAIAYAELNGELYKRFFLTDEENKAQEEGYIYIHDKGARLDTTNCFTRDTRFITSFGIRSFNDFVDGDTVQVLSHRGLWRIGTVHCFGEQELQRVTFVNEDKSVRHTVECTPNHRWILSDGAITTELKMGDVLVKSPCDLEGNLTQLSGVVWTVEDIEKTDRVEPVWCLTVEFDQSFVLEYGIPSGNCCLFDMKSLLKGGFRMGNISYREPKTAGTALSLIADVALNAGASQYGGFTISEIDKLLEPYAHESYDRYYAEYEKLTGKKDQMGATIYANKKLRQELEDGAIAIECKWNSCSTARGDYPFTSISFGLSKDRLGQMVTSAFLKVRKEGTGTSDHIPVLFPKLTFLYDEDMHGDGKEQEWLFKEAVECTQRAQYPDFLSMTGDGYAPSMYKKYGVSISRMGCVEGKSQVIYRDSFGVIHEGSIEGMWNYLSKGFPVLSQESLGYSSGHYIDLHGVSILDKDGFVNCSRIIKNTQNPRWFRVSLSDGKSLVCTADHPWTTWFGDASHVTQTKDLVSGDVVESFSNLPSYTEDNDIVPGSCSVHCVEIASVEPLDMTDVSYDVTTESEHFFCSGVRSHNCRANLSPWYERGGQEPADDTDRPVYEGRLNAGAISLNFPMIVKKAQDEGKDFYDVLTYYLDLCRKIHIRTLEYLAHKKAGINPLGFCEGGFYGGNFKENEEIGREFFRPMTVSFGISALNEATMMYKGKSLYEDKAQFAEEVLRFINDYANKYKKEDGILYAIYGTPAESMCFCSGTLVQCYGGNKEIQDIKEGDLVFSYNETLNKIELKPVVASSCTSKSATVVKVRFTNGQELVCTPNHPFAVRKRVGKDSSRETVYWVSAKDLTKGSRIKSNYVRLTHGRRRFTTYQYEHDVVAEYFFGEKPAGHVVHHIDENKLNNSVENLTYMKDADHRRLHMKDTIRQYCHTSESQSGCKNSFYGKHHTKCSIMANRKAHLGKRNVASKEVAQYTLNDVLVNVFESRGRAESITGFKNISNACNGVSTSSLGCHVAYGFKWFYTKDVESFSCENHVVESVEVHSHKIPVFNIEVADNHNYFVGGDDGVLVHNCALQVEQFRKKYGIVKGVSDRKYMSNSFHVHVSEDITPLEKMDAEYKCFHLCNGGNIIYNRFGSDYNTEAYVTLIREAMKRGYYYGCNISKNYCCTCGAEFLDNDKCPKCGSSDLVRISRVCGYLGLERVHGDTRMNEGKRAEINDRKCM